MHRGEELRYLILALQREGNRQLSERLYELKLTPSQAEVLLVLGQYPALTLTQLGERLVCETGTPSRLVKSMVDAGWVEKHPNPNDGRAVLLRLSPAAIDLLPALIQLDQQFNEAVAAQSGSEVLEILLPHLWSLVADTASGRALLRRRNRI